MSLVVGNFYAEREKERGGGGLRRVCRFGDEMVVVITSDVNH